MAGGFSSMTPTDLAAARTALGGKVALWAGPELDGKAIGAVQLLDVEVDSAKGRGIRGQALELTYGAGDSFGPPRRDSVVLTQIRADDPARSYLEGATTTPPGFADLQSGTAGSDPENMFRTWTASLRHNGFLVQIQGADRDLVLQAAKATADPGGHPLAVAVAGVGPYEPPARCSSHERVRRGTVKASAQRGDLQVVRDSLDR